MKYMMGFYLSLTVLSVCAVRADMTLTSGRSALRISEKAVPISLVLTADGTECLNRVHREPMAQIQTPDGVWRVANSLRQSGDALVLGFQDVDTTLSLAADTRHDWIGLRITSIGGTRPQAVRFVMLDSAFTEIVGKRLNIGWNNAHALCVMATSPLTDTQVAGQTLVTLEETVAAIGRGEGGVNPRVCLTAMVQDAPGPKMEGASAAIIACPTSDFKKIAKDVSHAYGLLTNETADGTPVKDTELVRGSYFFIGAGLSDTDKLIRTCNEAGIRQVMLSSWYWCTSVGHYTINPQGFPNGISDLKAFVERLKAAGITVGMHCFASKINKTDAYVSPVPDKRFWRQFEDTLAANIDPSQTSIKVRGSLADWPGSSKVAKAYWEGGVEKHREAVIGDEIIRYKEIGPEGVWDTLIGCERGAWKTSPASHAAGAPLRHYGVDGCINGYIVDQETTLPDETHRRLAEIFNTCGFGMVYFDGGEDVDRRRFDYYVSQFQDHAMRQFNRPVIHMGTLMTHRLWHSFARSSTVDTYLNTLGDAIRAGQPPEKWPTVKQHIDTSVAYMLSLRGDMMPGELGWFGVWPRQKCHGRDVEGLQLDELEYLLCRSVAYDCPVSLQTSFSELSRHPLTPQLMRLFQMYETARIARRFSEAEKAPMREPGKDFTLIQRKGFPPVLVPVRPVTCGRSRDTHAMVGAFEGGSVATFWNAAGSSDVTLDLSPFVARVADFDDQRVVAKKSANEQLTLPVTTRRLTLFCPTVAPAVLEQKIKNSLSTDASRGL
jgi:hypothetical protein